MAFVFIAGETLRRGLSYLSVNATTMVEDYICGALLLSAAIFWYQQRPLAPKLMAVAWAYATGGMFVPFFAHLEAFLRDTTFRPDHPHEDVNSIVLKGVIWAICLVFLIISLRSDDSEFQAAQSRAV
jgi:glucose-6-phosphate-specific signal transduction histidine kinase